jgi:hypothetical protein
MNENLDTVNSFHSLICPECRGEKQLNEFRFLVRDFSTGAKVELKKEMITDKVECPTCNGAGELNE